MTYDEQRQLLVSFGGLVNGQPSDELLELSLGGAKVIWTTPSKQATWPTPRISLAASATYDPTAHRALFYGGATKELSYLDSTSQLDDLWSWDGAAWVQLCSGCTGQPRLLAPIVFDRHFQRVVLTGGWDASAGEQAGTWEHAGAPGALFVVADSTQPTQRDSMGIAYEPVADLIVVHAGNGRGCGSADGASHCDETLEYRLAP